MDTSPSSTLSPVSGETHPDKAGQGKIEMVFRFWGGGGRAAENGENGNGHHPGLLALIEDAAATRRGVFVSSREYLFISRLKRPADALVVSRQVQLGLEGFRARHGSAPVAVSIAINANGGERANGAEAKEPAASGQEPPHDLVTLLKLSKPAQILLTHDLCRQAAEIKGLPLRSFPARFGVYEYLWTGEEKLDLLQSEPQLTLAALPAGHPAKEKTGAAGAAPGTAKETGGPPLATAQEISKPGLPRAYIFGGAGLAAVVLLAAIGIHLAQKPAGSPPSTAAPAPAVSAAPAQAPATGSAVPAVALPVAQTTVKQTAENRTADKRHAGSAKPSAGKPAPAPAQAQEASPQAPSADCTLGGDTSRYVALGEQARGSGDYARAVRIFREVLACDPNSGAAREGLAKAEQAQQQSQ